MNNSSIVVYKKKSHSKSIIPKFKSMIFTWSTKSEPVAYSVNIPTAKPNIAHLQHQHPQNQLQTVSIWMSLQAARIRVFEQVKCNKKLNRIMLKMWKESSSFRVCLCWHVHTCIHNIHKYLLPRKILGCFNQNPVLVDTSVLWTILSKSSNVLITHTLWLWLFC